MRNPEKVAAEMAERRQLILETGFRLFSEKTIEKVTMNQVAEGCGIGIATLYRYYSGKTPLVLDVNAWAWQNYINEKLPLLIAAEQSSATGAEEYALLLNLFIDMYEHNRVLLRFNQFFNIYMQSEAVDAALLKQFTRVMRSLGEQFHTVYEKGRLDGTLRMDAPEAEVFSATIHIMLAAVTRYAVGLVFNLPGIDPAKELAILKDMLLQKYTCEAPSRPE